MQELSVSPIDRKQSQTARNGNIGSFLRSQKILRGLPQIRDDTTSGSVCCPSSFLSFPSFPLFLFFFCRSFLLVHFLKRFAVPRAIKFGGTTYGERSKRGNSLKLVPKLVNKIPIFYRISWKKKKEEERTKKGSPFRSLRAKDPGVLRIG